HAIREDPTRKGLLYAGTQHGVYISYDDGASWQSLSLNLPDVPVADLIVEANDLVIGTHGRGFWVLDHIGPLRQYTPEVVAAADAWLFTPPTGIRSTSPVALTYWLKRPAKVVNLDVLDRAGAVIRSFTSDTTISPPGSPRPATDAGAHQLAWDLRYNSATTFPGMILWGATTAGPAAPPGSYTVRLTVDGKPLTVPVEVKRNPLFADVNDEDLHAQFALAIQVRDKVSEANNAVIEIRRIKKEADERMAKNSDARLKTAGTKLNTNLSDVEDDIYQVKNQSNQDPLNFPIKINNRLANLLRVVNSGDGRPIAAAPVLFAEYTKLLNVQTTRLQQVISRDLPAFNAELKRLGLPVVEPPKCAPGQTCATVL
ncbi:MAG TPA: hypothetical protein VK864_06915, partial [Longimicrobiales bacterium]|nr:hypothetical protein [Longimicrobiales bacterium]